MKSVYEIAWELADTRGYDPLEIAKMTGLSPGACLKIIVKSKVIKSMTRLNFTGMVFGINPSEKIQILRELLVEMEEGKPHYPVEVSHAADSLIP